jgi:hypothetical protein
MGYLKVLHQFVVCELALYRFIDKRALPCTVYTVKCSDTAAHFYQRYTNGRLGSVIYVYLFLGGAAGRRNGRYVSKEVRLATTTFFCRLSSGFGGFFAFLGDADTGELGAGLVDNK